MTRTPEKPKPGRPPVDGVTRSASILLRVTPEERERLAAAATRAGLGLGPWLRSLGLREARKP